MKIITIFTTTYNRKTLLPRLYESLCNQTCQAFDWLIVDDGSTDGTKILIDKWIQENRLDIRYIYKKNGGLHTARNTAYKEIETELSFEIDSDDMPTKNAVEIALTTWKEKGGCDFAGMVGLNIDTSGQIIGSGLPNLFSTPYRQLYTRYKVKGDKSFIFRTDIMLNIPEFPVFKNEKRVASGWKYSQIPDDKEIIIIHEPIRIVDYQPTGLSALIRKEYFNNPKGMVAEYSMGVKNSWGLKQFIKTNTGYIAFSLLAKNKNIISSSPKPISSLIFFPLGFMGYMYINIRWGKYKKQS